MSLSCSHNADCDVQGHWNCPRLITFFCVVVIMLVLEIGRERERVVRGRVERRSPEEEDED